VAAGHRQALNKLVRAAVDAQPDVAVRCQVIEGDATKVLLDAARQAALLVLGGHGHGCGPWWAR